MLKVLGVQPWDLGNPKHKKLIEIAKRLAKEVLGGK